MIYIHTYISIDIFRGTLYGPKKYGILKKYTVYVYIHTYIYIYIFPMLQNSRFCRRPPWKTRSFPKRLKSSMACGLARQRLELRPRWVSTRARILGSNPKKNLPPWMVSHVLGPRWWHVGRVVVWQLKYFVCSFTLNSGKKLESNLTSIFLQIG